MHRHSMTLGDSKITRGRLLLRHYLPSRNQHLPFGQFERPTDRSITTSTKVRPTVCGPWQIYVMLWTTRFRQSEICRDRLRTRPQGPFKVGILSKLRPTNSQIIILHQIRGKGGVAGKLVGGALFPPKGQENSYTT